MRSWISRLTRTATVVPTVVILWSCLSGTALALEPSRSLHQYNCQTWRRHNGLPATAVNALAQTPDGRLWLGTPSGLILFDGVQFKLIAPEESSSIAGKVITALVPRSAGGLWFGMERSSIGWYDGNQFRSLEIADHGPHLTVHRLSETRDKSLLVGAAGAVGMFRGTNEWKTLSDVLTIDAYSVFEDSQGRIWYGTAAHGLFYVEKDGKLKSFPDPNLKNSIITALTIDRGGNVWVGTTTSLLRYDPAFRRMPLNREFSDVRGLLVDRNGDVWVGCVTGGIARYRDGEFSTFSQGDGLANDRVTSILEAHDGSIWIGTADGLTQLSDVKFPMLSRPEGLEADSCLSVAASPFGGIWAGTPNGLCRYEANHFQPFGTEGSKLTSSWIKRLFAARNGDVYMIGAQKNVDLFRNGQVVASWTNEAWPRDIAEDSSGILIAIGDFLMRVSGDKLAPVTLANGESAKARWINDVLVARDDSIWIAADDGVWKLHNGALVNQCTNFGVGETSFTFLCEDDHGTIWGTTATGLARFTQSGISVITRKQGLHDDYIYAVVPDKLGHFWMDSNRGVFRVAIKEMNAVADGTLSSVNCTVFQGLDVVKTTDKLSQEYSGCRSEDGRIWFPSSKGVIVIDPNNIPMNRTPPPVFIEQVRINRETYDPAAIPSLKPGMGNFEFDFTALDYIAPQKIRFRYRLEGFDSDWVDARNRRSAFYTTLRPGKYRFKVQACNADGIWNTSGAEFAFYLPPSFHETIWFRVSAIAGACIVAFLAVGWRVRSLRRKQAELQQANEVMEHHVKQRTAQLAQANAALRTEIEERKRAQAETERMQSQLVDFSRAAGQAEVAASVLHNVGNVLNSVNVSVQVLGDLTQRSKLEGLGKALNLMQQHNGNLGQFLTADPKGQQIPLYLHQVFHALKKEQEQWRSEIKGLSESVDHIKEIVAMQQNYAKFGGVVERVSLAELTELSIKMNAEAFRRHQIKLVREIAPADPLVVDKHKVLQIVVNLLRNAMLACDGTGRSDKQITIRIFPVPENRIRLEVQDNGVGIAAENMTRIFSHGFTTRKDGHGFGLHSGVLAAREMGGTLTAFSLGTGTGATFTLELPLVPPTNEPRGASLEAPQPAVAA